MRYAGGVALVEVVRCGFVEGWHHGSVAVLDEAGSVVWAAGDIRGAVLPRSAVKPMQALAMLRCGLQLPDPADLAVVASSHSGEAEHQDRVRALLRRVGLSESHLRCPPAYPFANPADPAGPSRVAMNCSGKHAGMLATCVAAGWSVADYTDPDHPMQLACLAAVAEYAGEPVAAVAVDGCGAAAPAISLSGLARAFLRLVSAEDGSPERAVADAMRAFPVLVSGTGREDARLMQAVPGLLAKSGAEGVEAVALPGVGAVAVKVDDGGARARLPLVVAGLRRLGVDTPMLAELAQEPVLGGGVPVGHIRARSLDQVGEVLRLRELTHGDDCDGTPVGNLRRSRRIS